MDYYIKNLESLHNELKNESYFKDILLTKENGEWVLVVYVNRTLRKDDRSIPEEWEGMTVLVRKIEYPQTIKRYKDLNDYLTNG